MSLNRKNACITMMIAMAATAWIGTAPVLAQSNNEDLLIRDSGDITIDQPRVNVRGGALAERRPGNRIQAAISRHVNYSNRALGDFGGADLGADPRRGSENAAILADFITSIFDALNEILLKVLTGALNPDATTQPAAGGS